jgi:hypothetical protein
VKDLGPVAGTGANPGIPGIGSADLGEIVELPDGRKVAIFGDSFSGDKMGEGDHYRSMAVPVTGFDDQGRPIFGKPLTGPVGSGHELFTIPPEAAAAGAVDTLPAGTVKLGNKTYMMVAGTDAGLKPKGGSWPVEVTNDPQMGWKPVSGSWRAWQPTNPTGAPTQISGYQGSDGHVDIAGDSFDRTQGVTMYRMCRADPNTFTDRSTWQPWTGNGWANPNQRGATISPTPFGELSFREIDGRAVLSGFNAHNGPDGAVEIRVAASPTQIFSDSTPTVVAQGDNPGAPHWAPQNYGGYILPGSTLDDMKIFASQWNTDADVPYNVQEFQVKPNR